jgi:hypothetical protein
MIGLWRLFQGSGLGAGYLPDAGGALDQPAIMMQAFALMSDFEHRLNNGVGDAPAVPLTEDDKIDMAEVNRRNIAQALAMAPRKEDGLGN